MRPQYEKEQLTAFEKAEYMWHLLDNYSEIPPSHSILLKLCELLDGELGAIEEMVTVIKQDPALAALLVNLSNSAYYSPSIPVENLNSAVERVGFDEIFKMVSLVCRNTYMHHSLKAYGIDGEIMWERSLIAAYLMEHIAGTLDLPSGQSYLTGLVYELGKYPIAQYIAELAPNTKFNHHDFDSLLAEEQDLTGLNHLQAAQSMLENMGFAPSVTVPIGSLRDPSSCPDEHRPYAHMLNICRHFIPVFSDAIIRQKTVFESVRDSLQFCQITEEELNGILPKVMIQVHSTRLMVGSHFQAA